MFTDENVDDGQSLKMRGMITTLVGVGVANAVAANAIPRAVSRHIVTIRFMILCLLTKL
jgi:hypothetical protein